MGTAAAKTPLSAPLPFAAMVACVIAGFLALDHFANADEQLLLGAATWLILIASCASLDREDRARALLVVVVASCAEVIGSIVLGAYTYRLENLPAFVPPGHGLVFLAGLGISRSEPVRRHPRAFLWGVIGLVAAWGAAGLVLLGRTDALGAITGALLIYVLLRGRTATLYAGVFLMVGFLEIYGTSIGAWHWAATAPDTPLPTGNPPSGIAGVYVLFDIAAIALAPRVLAMVDRLRHLPSISRYRGAPRQAFLLLVASLGVAAIALPASASAGVTIGATGGNGAADCPADFTWAQNSTAIGSPSYVVPAGGGVITSWSHDRGPASATAQLRLKIFRKTTPGSYLTVGQSDFESLTAAGINTFATRVEVQGGDILGFRFTAAPISCRRSGITGDDAVASGPGQPDPPVGGPFSFGSAGAFLLNLAARVEPDCDRDGFGDDTQDTNTSPCTLAARRAAALARCKANYKGALKRKRAHHALTRPVKQRLKMKLRKCKRRASQLV